MLIALADEDDDEMIDWKYFLPIGLEAIRTFYARNLSLKFQEQTHPSPEALKAIYLDEIKQVYKLLSQDFNRTEKDYWKDKERNPNPEIDEKGTVPLKDFKRIVRGCQVLTPKEKNLLIRLQDPRVSSLVKHTEFPEMLYQVRYEIVISQ